MTQIISPKRVREIAMNTRSNLVRMSDLKIKDVSFSEVIDTLHRAADEIVRLKQEIATRDGGTGWGWPE